MSRVLLVDDDADVREAIGQTLELAGFAVTSVRALIEAVDHLTPGFPGVVVTDIRMPGRDGFAMLDRVRRIDPEIPVIVLTGEGDIPMAVRAMREGAWDFLEKPCPGGRLVTAVSGGLDHRRQVLEARRSGLERGAVAATAGGLAARMEMVERILIEEALARHRGRVAAVADALALPRKTLYDKLARHGIDPAAFREG